MITETDNTKNKPSHRLYQVTGEGKASIWTPFASAWAHKDAKGFTIIVPFYWSDRDARSLRAGN